MRQEISPVADGGCAIPNTGPLRVLETVWLLGRSRANCLYIPEYLAGICLGEGSAPHPESSGWLVVCTLRCPLVADAAERKPPPYDLGPPYGDFPPRAKGLAHRLIGGLRLLALVARKRELGSDFMHVL